MFLCVTLTWLTSYSWYNEMTKIGNVNDVIKDRKNPGKRWLGIWSERHEAGSHVRVELWYSSKRSQCVCKLWASKEWLSRVSHERRFGSHLPDTNCFSLLRRRFVSYLTSQKFAVNTLLTPSVIAYISRAAEEQPLLFFFVFFRCVMDFQRECQTSAVSLFMQSRWTSAE